eukprot:4662162-Lingulodinium_polyedra.AAC.1
MQELEREPRETAWPAGSMGHPLPHLLCHLPIHHALPLGDGRAPPVCPSRPLGLGLPPWRSSR